MHVKAWPTVQSSLPIIQIPQEERADYHLASIVCFTQRSGQLGTLKTQRSEIRSRLSGSEVFFLTPLKHLSAVKVPSPDTVPRNPSDAEYQMLLVSLSSFFSKQTGERWLTMGEMRSSINTLSRVYSPLPPLATVSWVEGLEFFATS